MTALGAFTIDLYLPAFPVIEGELDVPTAVIQPLIGAPDPALSAEILPSATDALLNALTPWVAPATTINFAGDADLPEFTRAWPPATFERLEAIRGEVDPEGTFAYGPPRG